MCIRKMESRRSSVMPLRLVKVGTVGTPVAYIRVTSSETENYATPSFVRGTGKMAKTMMDEIKTNRANLHKGLEKGIRLSELPQTLQNLIEVTRELGLK